MLREMKINDLKMLSELADRLLPNDMSSGLGVVFLKSLYFPQFYYSTEGFVIVSENECGEIDGFVCGSYDFKKQVKYLNFKLIYGLFRLFLIRPLKLTVMVLRMKRNTSIRYDLDGFGKLSSLAVSETSQGKGLGSRLTKELLNYLRLKGINKCYLSSRVGNKAAINMYKKAGFREMHEYESNNVRWVIMGSDVNG